MPLRNGAERLQRTRPLPAFVVMQSATYFWNPILVTAGDVATWISSGRSPATTEATKTGFADVTAPGAGLTASASGAAAVACVETTATSAMSRTRPRRWRRLDTFAISDRFLVPSDRRRNPRGRERE